MPLPPSSMAPTIDDPIELLLACHDKVRRFTTLTQRLRDHLLHHGVDAQAAEAAQSILRYFDLAAPLHHEDEDVDLFPALQGLGQPQLNQRLSELSGEHDALGQQWLTLRPWLIDVTQGRGAQPPASIDRFAQSYQWHAQREEAELYPWAQQLTPDQIRCISQAMVKRRTP